MLSRKLYNCFAANYRPRNIRLELRKILFHASVFLQDEKDLREPLRRFTLSKSKPKLAIIGSLPPGGEIYLAYLKRLCKELKIEHQVSFYPNANFPEELQEIIARSKICVSNGIEYFGIALAEQMSAGCIPIVYKHTAPWEDIVEEGKFGFGFETSKDLATAIDSIMNDEELQTKMGKIAIIRAKEFDEEVFREKMTNLLLKKNQNSSTHFETIKNAFLN